MPDTCAAGVGTHPDLWVEVSLAGTPLGRSKTGAVPYAIEANNATQLQGMTPTQLTSQLSTNLTALTSRVTTLETQLQNTTTTTVVMDNVPGVTGGLPAAGVTKTLQTNAGDLIIIAGASGYLRAVTSYQLDVAVQFDGNTIGHLRISANGANAHETLATKAFRVPAPIAGSHTITLAPGNTNTAIDDNDFLSVTAIQVPR